MSVVPLKNTYPSKVGGPLLHAVDKRIFSLRYFQNCMACSFCHDQCCSHGVDIDLENADRLRAAPPHFKQMVGVPQSRMVHCRRHHPTPNFPPAAMCAHKCAKALASFTPTARDAAA